ncbi:nuclear transport factor 2 family protein [Corynebacterium sp. ES2794-CONJ1]|uniref:nuclear transport factor 2 family protein n=1 Tax=unclassified Corynebacterium TaxID=2624378 RepID=UPI002169BA2F|nr:MULTISPECIES: nuclear transport factor 2 family protein [unclassified Corynebacterium]MCS4489045.1 nuclear transport factor 2 family protein [Corynebacterium sp. ES2775-CONJ]MCS4490858.1 nuclear transport factor 2 family protein [Corynebacterium sp. ES2715-CONJ3]MCS4531259.1 nuclear transport factor 2 family protein [Corynebacterium sp. ES2730-CONJ]MCU9518628.1 nuclear transport factor 2 family protein [Corynebacterium sp. ES2794-CONJ1]
MSFVYKKAAVATVAASSLLLVACGSDEAESPTTSVAVSTVTKAPVTTTVESAEPSAAPEDAEKKPEQPPLPPAPPAPPANPQNPAVPTEVPFPVAEHAPVSDGGPATPEQAAQIEGLIRGLQDQKTLRSFMTYVPNNSCQHVRDRIYAEAGNQFDLVPDVPLSEVPEFANANSRVDAITDIMVNGTTASANVTTSWSDGTYTGVQRFVNENGRWVFCD